jgi:hypothetical protein
MNNTLNHPISPTLINKCIGVALLPVAGYTIWTVATALASFDFSSLLGELVFTILPSACMLLVAVFCVQFALTAFRSEAIKKTAIVTAFFQIACILFLVALDAWWGGGSGATSTSNGDAGFAFAVIYLWVFVFFYLPAVVVATVCAMIGIKSLSRSGKKEQKKL